MPRKKTDIATNVIFFISVITFLQWTSKSLAEEVSHAGLKGALEAAWQAGYKSGTSSCDPVVGTTTFSQGTGWTKLNEALEGMPLTQFEIGNISGSPMTQSLSSNEDLWIVGKDENSARFMREALENYGAQITEPAPNSSLKLLRSEESITLGEPADDILIMTIPNDRSKNLASKFSTDFSKSGQMIYSKELGDKAVLIENSNIQAQ